MAVENAKTKDQGIALVQEALSDVDGTIRAFRKPVEPRATNSGKQVKGHGLAVVRDEARKRGIPKKVTGCRKPRWFAAACKRHRDVTSFFNPATIEKLKGKAEDLLLLSTLKGPAKDLLSILNMTLIVSVANK